MTAALLKLAVTAVGLMIVVGFFQKELSVKWFNRIFKMLAAAAVAFALLAVWTS